MSQKGSRLPFSSLSVVVPCFNEDANVIEIHRRITSLCRELPLECELIFVDDGSSDNTWKCIVELASTDSAVRGVRLSRNFGQQEALLAGLESSRGDLVVTLDADLQDPPEVLPEMITQAEKGAFVVYGRRNRRRHDPILKRFFAASFYAVIRRATGLDIPANTGEFRLARREVINAVLRLREGRPFLRGMFAWVGFTRAYVEYERPERFAGQPKFTFSRSLQLALDAFVSFSALKQRLLFLLGVFVLAFAVAAVLSAGIFGVSDGLNQALFFVLLGSFGAYLVILSFLSNDAPNSQRPNFIVQETVGYS